MAVSTMPKRLSDWLKHENPNFRYSRDQVTVVSGQNLSSGHVVGKVTASGKIKEYNPGNSDGSEVVFGVLLEAVDASAADKEGVVIRRQAGVARDQLTFFAGATNGQKDTAVAALLALGIVAVITQ